MPTIVTVFETKLRSQRALRDAMSFRRYTLRSLAAAVTRDLERKKQRGVSYQSLGHLLTGYQKTTRPEVARAIEEILDVPTGSLFEARVSNLSREVRNERGTLAPGIGVLIMGLFSVLVVAGVWAGFGWVETEAARMSEIAGQWIGGVL